MIPLKLQLRNFLSYGPDIQTVHFSPHNLICLSGKNGHGKSALLDAITWAIWGQARKVSGATKPDQGLLRIGQSHMMVCLDFTFNGQTFRVRRELTVTAKNKAYLTLDFGLIDNDTIVKPLTGKTTRKTQERIERILNLDFEAFSNSAFLRQGQSHEFSKKSPKERKEIIASILGLTKYENVRKCALEKLREANNKKNTISALQEKYTVELEKNTLLAQEQKEVDRELTSLTQTEHHIQHQLTDIEQQKKALAPQQKQRDIYIYEQKQKNKLEQETQAALRSARAAWRSVQKKLRMRTNPAQLEKKKKELEHIIQKQQHAFQKKLELQQELFYKKNELQSYEQKIITEYTNQKAQLELQLKQVRFQLEAEQKKENELHKEAMQLNADVSSLEKKQQECAKAIATYQKNADKQTIDQARFEKRKEHYHTYIAQGNMLNTELENLLHKKKLSNDEDAPCCPLCEQNLSAARKRFLKNKFEKEERFLRYRIAKLASLIKQLKALLVEQYDAYEKMKKQHEAYATAKAQQQEIESQKEKIALAQKKNTQALSSIQVAITELKKSQKKTTSELETLKSKSKNTKKTDPTCKKLEKVTKEIEDNIQKTPYKEQDYKKALQELQAINTQLKEADTMHQHIEEQKQRTQTIHTYCTTLRSIKEEKHSLTEHCKKLEWIAEKEQQLLQKQANFTQELQKNTQHKEYVLQKKGTLQAQQQALQEVRKKYTEQKKELTAVEETIDDYHTIAHAMSKEGIQALLIEEALPEIEQEANDILARLTNNQSQVIIESLRDLKKGGTKETLDIKISDAIGMRPYELFSGGEAFRIDFALRIAISKLLARRAGTSLQTLIIDEGFGSQDEEGLGRIMNALYAIQDDFSKIIIVSHLTSMKDQFPAHLTIEKGPSGSTIMVTQQG